MAFDLIWLDEARTRFDALQGDARRAKASRESQGRGKSSKAEGLFKQVARTIAYLRDNPKHPGLNSHEFTSMDHPFDPNGKVWEAYAQDRTPGAYRVFWCYGPGAGELTIIAITPHP